MNSARIFRIASVEMPLVEMTSDVSLSRHDVVNFLNGQGNIGIELGVAKGIYSKRMVDSKKFSLFFGVDCYGDIHDTDEYLGALKRVGFDNANYKLIRSDFDSALTLFPDNYFDYIYIDGYAHTGEKGGETIVKWFPKLKPGGILAGDDYHEQWPLVVWAVNDVAMQLGVPVSIAARTEDQEYCKFPTWFLRKNSNPPTLVLNETLYRLGVVEGRRIARLRNYAKLKTSLKLLLKKIFSKLW